MMIYDRNVFFTWLLVEEWVEKKIIFDNWAIVFLVNPNSKNRSKIRGCISSRREVKKSYQN